MNLTRHLAALTLTAVFWAPATPSHATGIPTVDLASLPPTLSSAISGVASTLKQIEQYRLQLQQYINMLQNTMNPGLFIWDDAVSTMNDLRYTIDMLSYYQSVYGSVANFTGMFHDSAFYRTSQCFTGAGCSPGQWAAIMQNAAIGGQSQKKAIERAFAALSRQQDNLNGDASRLKRLQLAAQTTQGQVEAMQYANMLASQEANQLLQIRALLIAQQNMEAARAQTIADKEAMALVADENSRQGTFRASPRRAW